MTTQETKQPESITGFTYREELTKGAHVIHMPEYKWQCTFGNSSVDGLRYQTVSAPNRFHRFMLRIFFDIHWTKLD